MDDALFALGGQRYSLACSLAQQTSEKALKAYLFAQGAEEVWGHSVTDLCEDAQGFDVEFEHLRKRVAPLDKYYIPTRYPFVKRKLANEER